jgi:SPP1 gp7 family putative phage head morphogenesis protein
MALNDALLARLVAHQVGLNRVATHLVGEITALLDATDADLLAVVRARAGDARSSDAWVNAALRTIREINAALYQKVQGQLQDELTALAHYETEYQLDLFGAVVPVSVSWTAPTSAQLRAIVTTEPFAGALLREWVAGLEQGRYDRLRQAIRVGAAEGHTTDQMMRKIRGTATANNRDGILQISRRSAEAMTRTAVAAVSSQARSLLYAANSEVIDKVQWVSTLDLRTTPICRARDGKTFPVDSGPRPPAHVGCRSTVVPVVKSWRELGIDADELPAATRASMSGQVPETLTYGEWLRGLPAAQQDEVLGKAKGQLFRAGGLTVDRFVDATGHAYTLDELKRREKEAWTAAFS